MKIFKDTVIIYHGHCTDGFAGAWVAWQKFRDRASYVPELHNSKEKLVKELRNKKVYFIDFCYDKDTMLEIEKIAKSLVVIDHHITSEEAVKSVKEHMFALDKSGCALAWEYFFPNKKLPLLIQYISDTDTAANKMPHYKEVDAYIYKDELEGATFNGFDILSTHLENPSGRKKIIEVGRILRDIHGRRVYEYAEQAKKINFDGYDVYAVNAPKEIRSELGYVLAEKGGKFGMVFFYERGVWKCSLRSANGFDVSELAVKYGGGGHQKEACFTITKSFPYHFNGVIKKKKGLLNVFNYVRV